MTKHSFNGFSIPSMHADADKTFLFLLFFLHYKFFFLIFYYFLKFLVVYFLDWIMWLYDLQLFMVLVIKEAWVSFIFIVHQLYRSYCLKVTHVLKTLILSQALLLFINNLFGKEGQYNGSYKYWCALYVWLKMFPSGIVKMVYCICFH